MKISDNRAWFLVLPATALLMFVGLIPLMTVVNFSLHDIFTLPAKHWVGFEWYQEIIQSERFHNSLGRSLLYATIILAIEIPLGICVALAMPRKGIFVSVCLVILALPLLVPWNIISMMWLSMIQPESGILFRLFEAMDFKFNWKINPVHTWILIVLMDVWHWTSLVAILSYSSLSTIPPPFYQAAAIDGASRVHVLRYIQLPKMKQVLTMCVLLRFMDSFMIYIEPFLINAGGPRNATMFLAMDLGEEIASFNYGPSAARSVIYFIVVLTVAWCFKLTLSDGNQSERTVVRQSTGS